MVSLVSLLLVWVLVIVAVCILRCCEFVGYGSFAYLFSWIWWYVGLGVGGRLGDLCLLGLV